MAREQEGDKEEMDQMIAMFGGNIPMIKMMITTRPALEAMTNLDPDQVAFVLMALSFIGSNESKALLKKDSDSYVGSAIADVAKSMKGTAETILRHDKRIRSKGEYMAQVQAMQEAAEGTKGGISPDVAADAQDAILKAMGKKAA